GSDNMRYINATILIEPELVEGAAFPRITKVNTNTGTEIPEQFRQFISETLLHPLREDEELGPLFSSLSGVEIKGDTLLLQTDPEYQPTAKPSPETKQSMFERLMTGFAIIVEDDKVQDSSMTLEEASKMILSAGLVAPESFRDRDGAANN
ncbi:MAG: hypothetical protein ACPIB0_00370, partial [Akkermansiaceae bacterium]